jgi:hypothetical protein
MVLGGLGAAALCAVLLIDSHAHAIGPIDGPLPGDVPPAPPFLSDAFTVTYPGPNVLTSVSVNAQGIVSFQMNGRGTVRSDDTSAQPQQDPSGSVGIWWETSNPAYIQVIHDCVSLSNSVRTGRQLSMSFKLPNRVLINGPTPVGATSNVTPKSVGCEAF